MFINSWVKLLRRGAFSYFIADFGVHVWLNNETGCILWTEVFIPPRGHDAFPPCFRFLPYFRRICTLCGNFSKFYLFTKKLSILIRQNFWWSFLDRRPQISNFPLFSLLQYISLCFAKIIISPTFFAKLPSVFEKFTCFLHTLCVFRFPPTLTMMHFCIAQYTHWTPLPVDGTCLGKVIKAICSTIFRE